MARYGTDIETLAQYRAGQTPAGDDPSLDVIEHLALAFAAFKKLEETGADLEANGRLLISPSIERAYREALHVRSKLPGDRLDGSWLTRYGRLLDENKIQNLLDGPGLRSADPEPGNPEGSEEPGGSPGGG